MTAFDRAWALLKAGEPMIEYGGNDICPECGTKMTQRKGQINYDRPVVHGWDCPKCESFSPHDIDYAHDLELDHLCNKCLGSGEQDEINRKRDSFECDECNGKGWKK